MSTTTPLAMKTDPNLIRTRDDVALFYREWGCGQPLVFLAGWTLNSEMWAYQMQPLSQQGFRCIAYDRRGHGRSSDPGKGYDFDTLADDLAAVLGTLDARRATVVAHSFASGEIVRYLTRYGTERVVRIAFLAPAAIPFLLKTPDHPEGIDGAIFDQLRLAFAQDFPGWAEANAKPYFVPGTPRAVIDWTLRMMTQTSLQAAVELSRIQTSTDFRDELSRIQIPTLIIHGDSDASAPLELTGQPAAALIPGARLHIYAGGPHGLYFTHQKQLNRDLAQFAATAEADKSA
ncbi:MAG: alpha/beta hydrolase [Acidobacteriaceae bacterium]|nr:alpha/beta hydrolase [Acidobacteriaceae bacterium]